MATPKLGYILPKDRTPAQEAAHEKALASMPKFAVPGYRDPGKVKVDLTQFWKHPAVVAQLGKPFIGFHQLTGSCVGASEGDAVATLSCVQATLTEGRTKAMIPFWPFPYGRTRHNEGDQGQGEGAMDSVMGETLSKEGVFDITEPGLPQFKDDDGLYLTEEIEMQWSDGASSTVTKWAEVARPHTLTQAPLNSVEDIRAAIINGYPVLDGASQFVGHGSIKGSGADAYVVGRYDGSGGHSTCVLGVWDHPNDGTLYLYSNQWPTSTYPTDPAGAGRCCVWITEATMGLLFSRLGGGDGETMALSHLKWFPAQPAVLDWSQM